MLTYSNSSHNPLPYQRSRGTSTRHSERIYPDAGQRSSPDDSTCQTVLILCLRGRLLGTGRFNSQLGSAFRLKSRQRGGHNDAQGGMVVKVERLRGSADVTDCAVAAGVLGADRRDAPFSSHDLVSNLAPSEHRCRRRPSSWNQPRAALGFRREDDALYPTQR